MRPEKGRIAALAARARQEDREIKRLEQAAARYKVWAVKNPDLNKRKNAVESRIARIEKGYNAKQGGAVGMILFNPALADTETDNHWLPAVHLADGADCTHRGERQRGVGGEGHG